MKKFPKIVGVVILVLVLGAIGFSGYTVYEDWKIEKMLFLTFDVHLYCPQKFQMCAVTAVAIAHGHAAFHVILSGVTSMVAVMTHDRVFQGKSCVFTNYETAAVDFTATKWSRMFASI